MPPPVVLPLVVVVLPPVELLTSIVVSIPVLPLVLPVLVPTGPVLDAVASVALAEVALLEVSVASEFEVVVGPLVMGPLVVGPAVVVVLAVASVDGPETCVVDKPKVSSEQLASVNNQKPNATLDGLWRNTRS